MALWRAIGLCMILLVAACLDPHLRLIVPDAGSKRDAASTDDAGTPDDAGDAGLDEDAGADAGDAGPVEPPDCGVPEPTVQAGPDPGMLLIPAGAFWQGCNAAIDTHCNSNEYPGRCVTLSEYEIDANTVTTSQYAAFVADAGATTPDSTCNGADPTAGMPDEPVDCVSQDQAEAYCAWVGKQLPTEAQYEKAARGTEGQIYPWGNQPPTCQLAVYDGCTDQIQDIGSLMAGDSPYGAADMSGNIGEMIADLYDPNYYSYAPDVNPTGPVMPVSPYGYVTRSCPPSNPTGPSLYLRCSERGYGTEPFPGMGFRCTKSVGQ